MPRKSIVNSFSLMPEQQEELDEILKGTGLSKSQLIQALLRQCKKNDLLVNLCVRDLINEKADRWATAHNVHYDEDKRKPGEAYIAKHRGAVSSNSQEEDSTLRMSREELDRAIEIAKTPIYED